MEAELFCRHPGAPMVMRHGDMGRAQELECVVDRVGEAGHAADIRTFANTLRSNRMMRRRCRRPVRLPFWSLDRGREEVIHERRRGHVAVVVVVEFLPHGDAKGLGQSAVDLALDYHW